MSDAEDNTKAGDRETKDSKEKSKDEEGHLDNQVTAKAEDGKDDGKNKEKLTPSKRNSKTKNQKKDEKSDEEEEEDDDDEEEEDGENDTNGKVPLLDQPLQISGTRDRKKVQRFSEEFKPVPKESPKNEIPEGRGQQLGDIPRIEALIQKYSTEKLKPLFRLLFNRPGKPATLKRYIRKFNGFDFKEGSDQYTRKRASILKLDMASLKDLNRSLDLTVGGSREEIVNRLLEFLMEPKDSEKPTKESKKKSTASSSKKTKRQKSNSSSKSKKKKPDSEEDEESSEAEMEVEDEKESSDEDDKKDSDDEKEDSEEDNKKRKSTKKKPTANSKKPASKKAEPKKETESKKVEVKADKKKRKETEVKSDDETSEDEPLVKKAKQPPTDDEIKSYVKQILEGANLEEITMKTVCKQVYAAYPEFDLAHKKDFIKTTVKSLIST